VPTEFWANAALSLVPTVFIGLLFWFVIRSILRMDRREREVSAKIEAEERAKAGLPPAPKVP
jgi:hypothetical protein